MNNNMDPPYVQLNDQRPLERVPTELTHNMVPSVDEWPDNPSLPELTPLEKGGNTPTVSRAMAQRFEENTVCHPKSKTTFWPGRLFDHLFDGDIPCLVDELIENGKLDLKRQDPRYASSAQQYWSEIVRGTFNATSYSCYRRLFALLILAGRENYLVDFIDAELDDSSLPWDRNKEPVREKLASIFHTFEDKKMRDLICADYQWQLTVPFIALPATPGEVIQVELGERSIRPWYQTRQARASVEQTRNGTYGEVHQIKIHPWQHDFGQILESFKAKPNLFALKTLTAAHAKELFDKEADMLAKFGRDGKQNVRLLAKIIERVEVGSYKYSLLFPWAEWDLAQYWEESQVQGAAEILWVAEQCYGLADALSYIHEPPGLLNQGGKQLYGRHGDIKPENILWFKNSNGEMLVFADMGLTQVHKDSSRSNIPGQGIPRTPGYRPPECDMAGREGYISRSFDIWTLGCVFLEFVVWILKGSEGISDFRKKRFTPYIDPLSQTNIFFSLLNLGSTREFGFQVQRSVTECFQELHENKGCTKYLHDFLDLIQKRMVIVESKDPVDIRNSIRRITSSELRVKMMALRDRCRESKAYYTVPCPQKSTIQPLPPVRAALNAKALELLSLDHNMSRLRLYDGDTRATSLERPTKPANI